jgi:hypothetical protein
MTFDPPFRESNARAQGFASQVNPTQMTGSKESML